MGPFPAVYLDGRSGFGVAWLDDVRFTEGSLEVTLQGRNVPQGSSLGLAFHGVDEETFDVVYFRPFSFQAEDPVVRGHAVQYVSHPAYTWRRLRFELPGVYEAQVVPAPDPDSPFKVRVDVVGDEVRVFVNDAPEPTLSVRALGAAKGGRVGLWVGPGSDGLYSNLKISERLPDAVASVAASDGQRYATFTASVVDGATKQPVDGASVVISGRYGGVTDGDGRVRISGIPAGSHSVVVGRIGYAPEALRVVATSGADLARDISLDVAPVEVAGLTVTTERRRRELARVGFYDRQRQGMGTFVDETKLQRAAETGGRLSDLFRGARGMSVVPRGAMNYVVVSKRASNNNCQSDLYVDLAPRGRSWRDINSIVPLDEIAGIEAYPSALDVPLGMRAPCGAIFIWTTPRPLSRKP